MITTPNAPTVLTVPQVAERLQITPRTVYNLISRGELRSIKVGGTRRILTTDLDAYLEADRP